MTDDEWLAARRTGIGSSDAAAVCGLDPWRTPLHVYLEKMGELPDSDNQAKRWGRRLEAVIAEAYVEESGNPVRPPPERIMRHPEYPWLLASLDRVTEVDGRPAVLEIKNVGRAGPEWGQPGTDAIPLGYVIQAQHQLLVSGLDHAVVAALFGGNRLGIYHVLRQETLYTTLVRVLTDFWQKVEKGNAPEPSWEHPATPELILSQGVVEAGVACRLGPEADDQILEYLQIKQRLAELRKDAAALKAWLTHAMGEAAAACTPGGNWVERRLITRRGYTVPETKYVKFWVRKGEEDPYMSDWTIE